MRLEIGDTRFFDDPSEAHVRREIELLAMGRSEFVILARREMDYIQAQQSTDGFVVEWQEGGPQNHWRAETLDADALADFFASYLSGDKNYKSRFAFTKVEV